MYSYSYGPRFVPAKTFAELRDVKWELRWPFLISTIIGIILIVFSLVIFALEIASLAQSTSTVTYNGETYGRTASTGAGIWCGFFIFLAGVIMLIIVCARPVRLWATVAFIATFIAAAAAIIIIGLDGKAVHDGSDLSAINQALYGSSYFAPKYRILAAQLAFAVIVFLFCLVFIILYIIVFVTMPRARPSYPPGVLRY